MESAELFIWNITVIRQAAQWQKEKHCSFPANNIPKPYFMSVWTLLYMTRQTTNKYFVNLSFHPTSSTQKPPTLTLPVMNRCALYFYKIVQYTTQVVQVKIIYSGNMQRHGCSPPPNSINMLIILGNIKSIWDFRNTVLWPCIFYVVCRSRTGGGERTENIPVAFYL